MPDRPSDPESGLPRRIVPIAHDHERPFWTSGERAELTVQRCRACGRLNHPPTMRCRHDHSAELEWTVVSGRGHVEGWTVNEHHWLPGFPAPYVVALVALEEDPATRLLTNLVGIDPSEIRHGLDVQVTFVRATAPEGSSGADAWIPVFEPAAVR